MPWDCKVYLEDILAAIRKIRRYTAGLSLNLLAKDERTFDAVVWNLEVIREAAKKIPEEVRVRHANVDWKKIASLRDILIHEYFGVDPEIIWGIVENKLPVLEAQVEKILAEQPS